MRGGGRWAAAAAVVVLAILLAFLLGEGPREKTLGPGNATRESRGDAVGGDGSGPSSRSGRTDHGAGDDPKGAASPVGTEGPGDPETPKVPGLTVLEDGTPLAGAGFLWEVETNTGPLYLEEHSDADGRVALPEEPEYSAYHPHAEAVSMEGGRLERNKTGWRVGIQSPGPFRITFRDKPGLALVRLIDADTDRPIPATDGIRVRWHIPGGLLSMGYPKESVPGGWIAIPEGRLPEAAGDLRADPAQVEVGFALPGFEEARAPLLDLKGRRELRVRPVPPDVRGTIEVRFGTTPSSAPPVTAPAALTADLRWTGPEPAPSDGEVLGLPRAAGPFALYAVPPGPWVLEVAGSWPDRGTVRGKVAFTAGGGTVDVGTVVLQPAGAVAVRVTDAAGKPIPQAWAVVVRPGEEPEQGRRLDLDEGGRAAVGDLEPGVAHRAVIYGLPRELEQTVVADPAGKTAEFSWPENLVPCRIRLFVERRAVADPSGKGRIPVTVQESPLPRHRGTWHPDGTFEAPLVPGTYRFSVLATPKEGGAAALFAGSVTVPAGDAFATDLELEREAR